MEPMDTAQQPTSLLVRTLNIQLCQHLHSAPDHALSAKGQVHMWGIEPTTQGFTAHDNSSSLQGWLGKNECQEGL